MEQMPVWATKTYNKWGFLCCCFFVKFKELRLQSQVFCFLLLVVVMVFFGGGGEVTKFSNPEENNMFGKDEQNIKAM